jgi:hypothetical protein
MDDIFFCNIVVWIRNVPIIETPSQKATAPIGYLN